VSQGAGVRPASRRAPSPSIKRRSNYWSRKFSKAAKMPSRCVEWNMAS